MLGLLGVIFTGVIVYVFSQYYLKTVLPSIIELKKLLSEISHTLLICQDKMCSASTENTNISKRLSDLSAHLRSSAGLIPRYMFSAGIRHIVGIPKIDDLQAACDELNSLSNDMNDHGKDQTRQAIRNVMTLSRLGKLLPIEAKCTGEASLESNVPCEISR